ncbi:MAG: molybdopterin-dependent oxidoreductase [Dehalococcoidia bacterium]
MTITQESRWHTSACMLCSRSCGVEILVEDGRFVQTRGDRANPQSLGYTCEKARLLDHYQNGADRLESPLRRRSDGTFETIDWETAIREVAAKLVALRDAYGGHSIAFYGGGGQTNHLGAPYCTMLRRVLGTRNYYNSLAQEKTGDFWVNGHLFGLSGPVSEDIEHADTVLFVGTNPWHSHGFANARATLKAIQKDPNRCMIVVDPRRTETAEMADIHLQIRPGTDSYLLAAMGAILVRDELIDHAFLDERTVGAAELLSALRDVPIADFVDRSGLDLAQVEKAVHAYAEAERAAMRVDLGTQQTLNPSLNAYLEKSLYLLTGNFGKMGGNNLNVRPLSGRGGWPDEQTPMRSRVTGQQFIAGLLPPNRLPAEILTDHPDRTRAVFVDSSNPAVSAADTKAYHDALTSLDLLVVIDVAMTETARLAHYVLPASSQFEKPEISDFRFEFPDNNVQLRHPVVEQRAGTLTEPEIYVRLIDAMGIAPAEYPELEQAARDGRNSFRIAAFQFLGERPDLAAVAPLILYKTLGRTLPVGPGPAIVWFACQRYAAQDAAAVERAGIHPSDDGNLGDALFDAILANPSGIVFSRHTYDDTWGIIGHSDRKVHLAIPELLAELQALRGQPGFADENYPFILAAGERRSSNANTLLRDPAFRKRDRDGTLRMHPDDAGRLGIADGERVRCLSRQGAVEATVAITDTVLPGVLTLPHGFGLDYPDGEGTLQRTGPRLNDLTSSGWCDPFTGTPYHKYVPVRLERAESR